MEDEPNVDPYTEEGIYTSARKLIEDGLIVETVGADGSKTWRLTKKGIAQAKKEKRNRRGK